MRANRLPALLAVTAVSVALLAACSSDAGSDGAASTKGTMMSGSTMMSGGAKGADSAAKAGTFVLTEWGITAPSPGLMAGKVRITAENNGKETHELVLIRMGSDKLDLKADGSVNEAMIPAADKVGEIGDIAAGTSRSKVFDLPAGRYLAFCNLVETMKGSDMHGSDMHGSGMSGSGMSGSGMDGSGMDGSGSMIHVHFKLGMQTPFAVS